LHSNKGNTELKTCKNKTTSDKKLNQFKIYFRSTLEALALGTVLGLIDISSSEDYKFTIVAYFAGAAFIGFRHVGHAFPCWPVLGISLYAIHVIAIACGRKPPYVEENYQTALGIMSGASFRVILSGSDSFRRTSEPALRFFPKTTRQVLLAVVCIGMMLGCIRQMLFPPTIYSKNYNERNFRTIKQGFTTNQVFSLVGQPLKKSTVSNTCEVWEYSVQYNYLSNYERRQVNFESGLVRSVIMDYWVD